MNHGEEADGGTRQAGKRVVEFTGIMSNPTYAKVQEGAKSHRDRFLDA